MFRRRRWFQGRPDPRASTGHRLVHARRQRDDRRGLGGRLRPSRSACSSTARPSPSPTRGASGSSTTASSCCSTPTTSRSTFTLPDGLGRAVVDRARHGRGRCRRRSTRRSAQRHRQGGRAALAGRGALAGRCSGRLRVERRSSRPTGSSSARASASTTPPPCADYLADLGVSHVYCSPYLQAAPGSTHGYDVVDHARVNEELGGRRGPRPHVRRPRRGRAGPGARHRAQPHGDHAREPVVVGRARERAVERYAAYFDVDWDPPETQAAQHRAAAGPRRPLRPGARGGRHRARAGRRHLRASATTTTPARSRPGRSTLPLAMAAARSGSRRAGLPGPRRLGRCRRRPPPTRSACATGTATRRCSSDRWPACAEDPDVAAAVDAAVAELNADVDALDVLARAPELPAGLLAHGRARSSTTAASSTSTPWPACASRTSRSSPTPTPWSSRWLAEGVLDGCASTTPTGCATPRATCTGCGPRPRRRGSWSRRSSSRARRCRRRGRSTARPATTSSTGSAACSSTPAARRR